MKYTILAFIAIYLMISLNCQAQVTTYDIGDYKLPDVQWRALETNFGMSGSNFSSKSNHTNTFGAPQSYLNATDNILNSFNGGFGLNYSHFQNTRTLQRFTQAGVSSSYISRGEKSFSERISEQREFQPRMFVYCENRIYFRNNMFYEINPDVRYVYMNNSNFQRRPENTDLDIKYQSHQLNTSVPLKVGIGRIEQVQDARQAIYIFDELARIGRSGTTKNDNEVVELAEQISRLNNERFFDFRLRRMEEIEAVDSFLLANDHVIQQDARYFTTLNDFWIYGNAPVRNSGNRISLVFLPGYMLLQGHTTDEISDQKIETKTNTYRIGGGLEFVHEKPLNLYWQNSVTAGAYVSQYNQKQTDFSDVKFKVLETDLSHTIGYYPNTRTIMSFSNNLRYKKTKDNYHMRDSSDDWLDFRSILDISYYVSPQLRIGAYAGLYYSNRDFKTEYSLDYDPFYAMSKSESNSINFNYGINLIYKVF